MGKHFRYYHINTICRYLGEGKCKGLPFYHAFTGCDSTSQFHGKAKKSTWGAWKSYLGVSEAFEFPIERPFQLLELTSPIFHLLERFMCVL